MRILALTLGLLGLSTLICCDEQTSTEPEEAVSPDDDKPVHLTRGEARTMQQLGKKMDKVFGGILDEKKDAFSGSDGTAPDKAPFSVTIKDMQILTPYMRTLRMDQTFNSAKEDTRQNRGQQWGAGITVEVRNDTGEVLLQPNFTFGLKIKTGYGDRTCTGNYYGRYQWAKTGSPQPSTQRPWASETKGSERYWRPGETVRRQMATTGCSDAVLLDTGITGASVVLDISGPHLFSEDGDMNEDSATFMNDAVKIDLPAEALTLRGVRVDAVLLRGAVPTVGDGRGYAFGSGIIAFQHGKIVRGVLNDMNARPDSSDRFTALPEATPPVNLSFDELSVTMDGIAMTHWTDSTSMKKGTREVTVQLKQTLDSGSIRARLRAQLDAAVTTAAQTPTPAAVKALATAQKAHDSGLASQRSKLSTALACDRIQLITATRNVGVSNAAEVRGKCAALTSSDAASAVLRFTIPRYDVPVALTYAMNKTPSVAWIASQATTTWDPR